MNDSVTDQLPDAISDAVDAVRSTVQVIDFGDVTDSLGDAATVVIESAGDLVGAAGDVSLQGGRLVVRVLRSGGRTVQSHPRLSAAVVALVLAALAGLVWSSRRSDDSDTNKLKVAA